MILTHTLSRTSQVTAAAPLAVARSAKLGAALPIERHPHNTPNNTDTYLINHLPNDSMQLLLQWQDWLNWVQHFPEKATQAIPQMILTHTLSMISQMTAAAPFAVARSAKLGAAFPREKHPNNTPHDTDTYLINDLPNDSCGSSCSGKIS